mmetsp:Transcript_3001/g.8776  ORF Transcript_3001/g.8776 Transcript_3001/m.8776 type:complete len:258 (-) Transcript_3001:304-1077(-)
MPLSFRDFLSVGSSAEYKNVTRDQLQARLEDVQDFPAHLRHCLLIGTPASGKTALLFHLACKRAALGQGPVIFVRHRLARNDDAPALPCGLSAQDPLLENIHLRYLSSLGELKTFGACLHLLKSPPAALIIDDFSRFELTSTEDSQRQVMAALSYLRDAADWASDERSRLGAKMECPLVVSDVQGAAEGPRLLFLLRRWLPCVLQLAERDDVKQLAMASFTFEHHRLHESLRVALEVDYDSRHGIVLKGIREHQLRP